jgi:hypothetical protein
VRRLAALLVLAALAATGCGGKHTATPRERVSAYIGRVNAIEAQLRAPVGSTQQAVSEFSSGHYGAATIRRLAKAEATLAKLQRRLAAAAPPAEARKLHRLLVSLVAQERSLVAELHTLTLFDPAFTAALGPLAAANAQSQADLKGQTDPAAVAAVVERYRTAVEGSLTALRRLEPPTVERPSYDAQVHRLVALDAALGKLRAAVLAKDPQAAARAEHAIAVASVSTDSTANQAAQRDAVRAYDAAVRRVRTLESRIAVERNRLQVSLG